MKIINYKFETIELLLDFINKNNILNTNKTFIQIFYSNVKNKDLVIDIKNYLNKLLPNSSIMGTSSAGVINNFKVENDCISISFSIFEKSTTSLNSYKNMEPEDIIKDVKKNLIHDNTKLLIIFANSSLINSNALIHEINKRLPHIIVAGGNAGDDLIFNEGLVFCGSNDNSDVVITAIHSDNLTITTNYLLNWQTIGKEMIVTKSENNIIYEIDNIKAVDIYRQYLGDEVANKLPESGIEFPLIFLKNGIKTARVPTSIGKDESLVIAGNVEEGCAIKFGFANIEYIEESNLKSIENKNHCTAEATYIYSCYTRKKILDKYLDDELELLSNISDASGFMTFGEFYYDENNRENSLLNITTTYVTLNENESDSLILKSHLNNARSKSSITQKALTNLVDKTTRDLQNSLYYLKQFKDAMYTSLIFSSANKNGDILDVNKNFEKISGYTKKELLGKKHSIVRSPDMKSSFFKKMWSRLSKLKEWKGVIKNQNKNGNSYYVLAHIFPILNTDGTFKEYISLRHDITDRERRRERLEGQVDELSELTEDKEALLNQYAEVINSFASSYRFNLDFMITYGNNVFKDVLNINDFSKGVSLKDILEKDYYEEHIEILINTLSKKEKFKSNIVYSINGKKRYMDASITPILDKHGDIIEYMVIEYEITDILTAQQEIIDTQKDIIFTMGEIGETRSKETGYHVKRVAEYSKLFGLLCGMSDEESDILKMASPMHDIGKVGIPDHILNKPGKLTPDEWEIMKTHAELGYSMLKGSNREILKLASVIAKYHHEKWNGNGYPEGLKGFDIPLEARITAVADVFDALGSDRSYKKAWELDKIFELLKEEKGKHFDPKLIDLFFKHLHLFLEIRDTYKDC